MLEQVSELACKQVSNQAGKYVIEINKFVSELVIESASTSVSQ